MGWALERAATALLLPRPCVLKPGFVQVAQESWAVLTAGRGELVGRRGRADSAFRRMEMAQPRSGWKGWRPPAPALS